MLTAIIHYIEGTLTELAAKESGHVFNKKHMLLMMHLEKVARLLTKSENQREINGDLHIIYLKKAIIYLENIPILKNSMFFHSVKALGQILRESRFAYPTLLNHKITAFKAKKQASMPLHSEAVPWNIHFILGSIHISLMPYFKKIWFYPFEIDMQTKQVLNDQIIDWQTAQMRIKRSSHASYKDFERNICIQNKKGGDSPEIESRIDTLLNDADGYDEPAKILLKHWLTENGGQNNNRFLDLLIESHYFTRDDDDSDNSDILPNIGRLIPIEQNWHVANGKICFDYLAYISSIEYGTRKWIMTLSNGEVAEITDSDDFEAILNHYKIQNKILPPLLSVNAKLQLEIIEKEDDKLGIAVLPMVKKLEILSFTSKLHKPQIIHTTKKYDLIAPKKNKKENAASSPIYCLDRHHFFSKKADREPTTKPASSPIQLHF